LSAADDRVRHPPAGLADRRGELGEEVERERGRALPGDVAEEEEEDAERRDGGGDGGAEHEPLTTTAPLIRRLHARAVSGARTLAIRIRATAFTMSVITKSTRPISTSAAR